MIRWYSVDIKMCVTHECVVTIESVYIEKLCWGFKFVQVHSFMKTVIRILFHQIIPIDSYYYSTKLYRFIHIIIPPNYTDLFIILFHQIIVIYSSSNPLSLSVFVYHIMHPIYQYRIFIAIIIFPYSRVLRVFFLLLLLRLFCFFAPFYLHTCTCHLPTQKKTLMLSKQLLGANPNIGIFNVNLTMWGVTLQVLVKAGNMWFLLRLILDTLNQWFHHECIYYYQFHHEYIYYHQMKMEINVWWWRFRCI